MNNKILLGLFFVFLISFTSAASNIEVGSLLLKVSMHKGELVSKDVSVSSVKGGVFSVTADNLPDVTLSESEIKLDPRGSGNVNVIFNGSDIDEGVYVGSIVFQDSESRVSLPVILEVESSDIFFDGNVEIPVNYNEVPAGGKLLVNIRIFDLVSGKTQEGLGSSPIVMEYKIFSAEGNVLSSETESIVVNGQANLAKTFSFPDDVKTGSYVLGVVIRYKSSVATATSTFRIITPGSSSLSFFRSIDPTFLLVLIVMVIFFAGLLFAFFYLIKDRDKLFGELRKYNELEMTKQQQLLEIQKRLIEQRLDKSNVGEVEKEKVKEKVQKEIVHKVTELKVKQKKREHVLSRMKKQGASEDKISAQIGKWKKEGYNTLLLRSKLGLLTNDEMKKMMDKWKGKYSG